MCSSTLLLKLSKFMQEELFYEPGDHLGVFACNNSSIVEGILKRIDYIFDPDEPVQLQLQKEIHTPNGLFKNPLISYIYKINNIYL